MKLIEDFGLKVGIYSHLNENIKISKYKRSMGWLGSAMVLGKLPVPRCPTEDL